MFIYAGMRNIIRIGNIRTLGSLKWRKNEKWKFITQQQNITDSWEW